MANLTYELNEIIICKNVPKDPFGYPAKIMEIKQDKGMKSYLVHYKGWNTRFDIWVDEDEVENMFFKHTPEVEAAHKQMLKDRGVDGGKSAKKNKVVDTPTMSAKKRKVADREGSADSSQDSSHERMPAKDDVSINIPDKLRGLLLDDSDLVNRQHKLVKLPAQFTIERIINDYEAAIASNDTIANVAGNDEMLVEYNEDRRKSGGKPREVVLNKHDMAQSALGVLDYFNILLGSQLLYAGERKQYENWCVNPSEKTPGRKVDVAATPELEEIKIVPASVYGLPHLCRLFARIGPLIGAGNYGNKSLQLITNHITDLMIFLSKNVTKYHNLDRDYDVASKHDLTAERD